ncbi:MAG: YbbR-like domain-containing protein [Acutalibacteraceae bacterium]
MNKNIKNKKNKKSIFSNNRFLMILSLFLAAVIWVGSNYTSSSDTSITISDIPITIDLPEQSVDEGLQIFSGGDITASVTVTGNRVTLGTLSKDDIQVVALQTSSITTTGSYTLSLQAKKAGVKSNYEIGSTISPSIVTIFVDRYKEVDIPIENNLSYKVADDYYGYVTMSNDTVKVSGPETEISKIDKVAIVDEFSKTLTKSVTSEQDIVMYNSDGDILQSNLVSASIDSVSTTINVLPTKEVSFDYDFESVPKNMKLSEFVSVSPETIVIAGPDSTLNKTDTLSVSGVDFSKLSNKLYNYDLPISLPKDCKDIANVGKVSVSIDLSGMASTLLKVTNFEVKGLSEEYRSVVTTKSIMVRVYGPSSEINSIKNSDVYGVIDFTDFDNAREGSIEMPVEIKFNTSDLCWAYGDYTANISISK